MVHQQSFVWLNNIEHKRISQGENVYINWIRVNKNIAHTSNGVDSSHKTLNNTKLVMNDLQAYTYIQERCQYKTKKFIVIPLQQEKRKEPTLAKGARQLVVQLALETMLRSGLYSFSLTPITNMGASLLGAEIITFFAPP